MVLVIHEQQLKIIEETRVKEYCAKTIAMIKTISPSLVAGRNPTEVEQIVAQSIAKCEVYRINQGNGVLAFVGLSLAAGKEFIENPTVQTFLQEGGQDSDAKIEWLFNKVLNILNFIRVDPET